MSANKIKRGNNVMVRNMKDFKYFLAVFAAILTFQSVVLLINFCSFLWTSPEQIYDANGKRSKSTSIYRLFSAVLTILANKR